MILAAGFITLFVLLMIVSAYKLGYWQGGIDTAEEILQATDKAFRELDKEIKEAMREKNKNAD